MFKFITFASLLVCAVAAPASVSTGSSDGDAQVTNYNREVNPDGSYTYQFDTSNGINVQETGAATGTSQGSYKYISPEGETIQVDWTADEGGFKPVGDHLPTPSPEVQKALDYILAHPPPPESEQKK